MAPAPVSWSCGDKVRPAGKRLYADSHGGGAGPTGDSSGVARKGYPASRRRDEGLPPCRLHHGVGPARRRPGQIVIIPLLRRVALHRIIFMRALSGPARRPGQIVIILLLRCVILYITQIIIIPLLRCVALYRIVYTHALSAPLRNTEKWSKREKVKTRNGQNERNGQNKANVSSMLCYTLSYHLHACP